MFKNIIKKIVNFIPLILAISLASCSSNSGQSIRLAKKADGPKELYVRMPYDSISLTLDLKQFLTKQGYDVALDIEEGSRDIIRSNSSGATEIIRDATFSKHRYELFLKLTRFEDRYPFLEAMIRDREKSEIIATYQWNWENSDRFWPAPKLPELLNMLNDNFLKPTFH